MKYSHKQLLFLLMSAILLYSCKKNTGDGNPPNLPGEQVKLPHGNVKGEIAIAQIGAGGGTLTSKDGTLTLNVPAGTVNGTTTFSIQEVENVLKNQAKSYRLLPDNIRFDKPVTLTYHYNGLELGGTNPDFLFLAYQDAEGRFFSANKTRGDKQARTLTVSTTHFSDWTFFAEYELYFPDHELWNGQLRLKEGEEAIMQVFARELNKAKDTAELTAVTYNHILHNAAWDYSPKKGTMKKLDGRPGVLYKAPAKVTTQETIFFNITLNGKLGTDNLGNTVQQMQLRQPVVIEPDSYFILKEGETEMTASTISAEYIPSMGTQIGATFFNGYMLNCYTYNAGVGGFPYREHGQGVSATLELTLFGMDAFNVFRPKDCDQGGEMLYSPGNFVLKSVANKKGEYFEGEFTSTLFFHNYCQKPSTKNISGRFRIRKNL